MKVVNRTFGEIDFVITVSLMVLMLTVPVQTALPEYIAGRLQKVELQSLADH